MFKMFQITQGGSCETRGFGTFALFPRVSSTLAVFENLYLSFTPAGQS